MNAACCPGEAAVGVCIESDCSLACGTAFMPFYEDCRARMAVGRAAILLQESDVAYREMTAPPAARR
jgi:hypothetical protein